MLFFQKNRNGDRLIRKKRKRKRFVLVPCSHPKPAPICQLAMEYFPLRMFILATEPQWYEALCHTPEACQWSRVRNKHSSGHIAVHKRTCSCSILGRQSLDFGNQIIKRRHKSSRTMYRNKSIIVFLFLHFTSLINETTDYLIFRKATTTNRWPSSGEFDRWLENSSQWTLCPYPPDRRREIT